MTTDTAFRLALAALGRNRLQTGLTMLGIAIGVGAVLAMVALGSGAQAAIADQVMAAGANVITITAGNYRMKQEDGGGGVVDHQAARFERRPLRPDIVLVRHPENDPMEKHDHATAKQRLGDAMAGLGAAATLTAEDAAAIRAEVDGVQYVAVGIHENARIIAPTGKRWMTRLHGTSTQMPLIRRAWIWQHGAFFGERDERDAAQVMVLGTVAAARLFGAGVNPVGQTVQLWNQPFRVVGVAAGSTWTAAGAVGDDQFDAVYVPYTTVLRLLNLTRLNTITVTSASVGQISGVAKAVTELLRVRHGIIERMADDFTVKTQAREALAKGLSPDVARAVTGNLPGLEQVTLEELTQTLERSSRTMTALLAGIAAVSLVVGGIGIMNIMLLSVTERTREIGTRIAVGARERDVLLQFLVEAVALSLAGGVAGIVLGAGAAAIMARAFQWAVIVPPGAVLLAFGMAAVTGVFFGFYPARQASRLNPIDALRYE